MNKYLIIYIIVLFGSGIIQAQNTYYPWESFKLKDTETRWIQRELDTSLLIEGESNGSTHLQLFNYVPPHIENNVVHSILWANVTDHDGWLYEKIDLESGKILDRRTFDFRDQEEPHHHVPRAFYINSENEPVIISLRNIDPYESSDLPYFIRGAINHLSKQIILPDTILNQYASDSNSMAKLLYFPYGPDRLYQAKNDNIIYATTFPWDVLNNTPTLSFVRESYNDSGYLVDQTDTLTVPVPDSAYGGVEIAHRSQLFLNDGTSLLSAGIKHLDAIRNSVMHVYHIDKDWNILGEYDISPFFDDYRDYRILGADTEKMTFLNRESNGNRAGGTIVSVDYNGHLLEKIEGFSDGSTNYNFVPQHVYFPKGEIGIYVIGTSLKHNSIDVWRTNGMGDAELAERIQAQNPKMSIYPISIQFTDKDDLLIRARVVKDTVVNGNQTTWGDWKYIMLIDGEELGITTGVEDQLPSAINYEIYPNPAYREIEFAWPDDQLPLPKTLQLLNIDGRLIEEQKLSPYQTTVNTNLPAGLYLLNISDHTAHPYQAKKLLIME